MLISKLQNTSKLLLKSEEQLILTSSRVLSKNLIQKKKREKLSIYATTSLIFQTFTHSNLYFPLLLTPLSIINKTGKHFSQKWR